MAKKRKNKNKKKSVREQKERKPGKFALPEEIKRLIWAIAMFLAAVIILLSFFDLAGKGGSFIMDGFSLLFGRAVFAFPLFLILGGLAFWSLKYKNRWPVILAICLLTVGTSVIFECLNHEVRQGGWVGYLLSWPFLEVFGLIVTQVIFGAVIVAGAVIFWQFLHGPKTKESSLAKATENKPAFIKRIFAPKFKVKPVEFFSSEGRIAPPLEVKEKPPLLDLKTRPIELLAQKDYHFPSVDLLEADKGMPSAGDVRINSAIIKRTLQNFDIQVEMSEVNIGPTVTQYTLKPAEGVKLAKITALSNDLSLALAAHPIRIEAPIPGRPLVGIEIPNKTRTLVRLRNLIEHQNFQNSLSNLTIVLGRDVASNPIFADLSRMPHLLVAGSTGTGKTIALNSIILSLLYQNSPETLRFILIDPKRVEFPVYNNLPHLLTPVIFDAQKAVNALKWLIEEMERRFDVLSLQQARDVAAYNEIALKQDLTPLPYIVLIIDELADLMAARGREIEAGIVRLAQMARAVGIHLVVATQRPSVEVITGLIKANITSRITFQVASQVDSRTVLDMAGAEKLLGLGDMLFVSAEIAKPKRVQAAYVSDKEVKRVVKYIKSESKKAEVKKEEAETTPGKVEGELSEEEKIAQAPFPTGDLSESLQETLEKSEKEGFNFLAGEEDPLYEEAKKVVIEAKKASASLLQRRLRIGYARAARLIDTLEERGVVGPGEGAKPREIYFEGEEEDDGWKKV